MARISSLPSNIVDLLDRFVGTDENGRSKNFGVSSLVDYTSRTGLADPSRLALIWNRNQTGTSITDLERGQFALPNSTAYDFDSFSTSTTTALQVSRYASGGQDALPLLRSYAGGTVKLNVNQNQTWYYGVFEVTSVVYDGANSPDHVTVNLTLATDPADNAVALATDGTIPAGDGVYLALSPLGVGSDSARSITNILIGPTKSNRGHDLTINYSNGDSQTFTDAFFDGEDGADGVAGAQGPQGNYYVKLFRRSSTNIYGNLGPTDVTWTPGTGRGSLSGDNADGWALLIPSGTDPVFEVEAFFNPSISTSISNWSSIFNAGSEGPAGPEGRGITNVEVSAPDASGNRDITITYTDAARQVLADSLQDGQDGDSLNATFNASGNILTITNARTGATITTSGDLTGPQGDKGDTGERGLQGPAGMDSTVPGPQGPAGPQGPHGPFNLYLYYPINTSFPSRPTAGPSDVVYNEQTGVISGLNTATSNWYDNSSDAVDNSTDGELWAVSEFVDMDADVAHEFHVDFSDNSPFRFNGAGGGTGGGNQVQVIAQGESTPRTADTLTIVRGTGIEWLLNTIDGRADSLQATLNPSTIGLGSIDQDKIMGLETRLDGLDTSISSLETASTAETTQRMQADQHLSDAIANQDIGVILRRSGATFTISGPVGDELIRSVDQSDLVRLAYYDQDVRGHRQLSIEFLPDSATLANGIWTLMENGSVVATLPTDSSAVVARYTTSSPTAGDATSFSGHPKFAHWNGTEFFYDLEIIGDDSYLVANSGAANTEGERSIAGQDLTDVFRNWRETTLMPLDGVVTVTNTGGVETASITQTTGDDRIVSVDAIPKILTSDIAEATIPVTITATTTVDIGLGADYASISQQLASRQPLTLYKRNSTSGAEHRVFVRFVQLDEDNQTLTCTIDSREGTFTSDQTGPWSLFPSWAGTGTGGSGTVSLTDLATVETIEDTSARLTNIAWASDTTLRFTDANGRARDFSGVSVNVSNAPTTLGHYVEAFRTNNSVQYFVEYTLTKPATTVTLELYGQDHDLNGGNEVAAGTHTELFLASDLTISNLETLADTTPVYGDGSSNLRLNVSYTDGTSEFIQLNYSVGNGVIGVQFATQENLQDFISDKEEFRTNIGIVDAELRAETDLPLVTSENGNPTLSSTTTYNLQGFRYHTTGNNRSFELDINGRAIQTYSIENGAFEETFTLTADDIDFIEGSTDLDVRLTPTAVGSSLRSIIVTRIGSGADFFAGRIRANASSFSLNLAGIDVGTRGTLTLTAENYNAITSIGSISGLTLDVFTTENTVLYQFKMKVVGFNSTANTIMGDITYINQALANTTLTDNPTSWIVTFGGFAQETVTQPEPPSELQADLPTTAIEVIPLQRYKGRYTLHTPEPSAPTVNLYGRPPVTVPATLPSTVGTHEFLMWWTAEDIRMITDNNGDDAAVYGTSGSNLSLITDEGSFRFTDNYANEREDIEALQQRVGTLETEFQQVIHDVHADAFDFVTYPWAFWNTSTTSTVEITYDDFQTLSIFRGNRRPQFGGSASNIDSLIQGEAGALSDTTSQYAVVSFNRWDGTTEEAGVAIGFVLDGTNPQTDQWQLYYTPGFSDSIPSWRRARVTFYATEALFLAFREGVTSRGSQLLIPGTRAQIDDLIAHFGTNTEQHANVQVRYFLDGNATVQAGEVMAVNSNGGIPFTNASYRNLHYVYLQLVGVTSTITPEPNQPIDIFIDRNGIVGQRLTNVVQNDDGTFSVTRINQDGTSTTIVLANEIILRSDHAAWNSAGAPPDSLGVRGQVAIDNTTNISQIHYKTSTSDNWASQNIISSAPSPSAELNINENGGTVSIQPSTPGNNVRLHNNATGDVILEDVTTINGIVYVNKIDLLLGTRGDVMTTSVNIGGTPTDVEYRTYTTNGNVIFYFRTLRVSGTGGSRTYSLPTSQRGMFASDLDLTNANTITFNLIG